MNGHCSTCDREDKCGYMYKPCDCFDHRKFTPKLGNIEHRDREPIHVKGGGKVIQFPCKPKN